MGGRIEVTSTVGVGSVFAVSLPLAAAPFDCRMPELEGYEVSAEIRRWEAAGPRTPIVAMTANARPGDRERCLPAGMEDYVSKPINPQSLVAALDRWLRRVSRGC